MDLFRLNIQLKYWRLINQFRDMQMEFYFQSITTLLLEGEAKFFLLYDIMSAYIRLNNLKIIISLSSLRIDKVHFTEFL
ncbi:unnamed protein product [Blepharisma stoltei]|uniref:Uncharacterized protein n=1 Tax=Blepharisma stoltei TaxID=1481888 RepID=A0AAU9J749_9CILI|nr:unnamed protein product [Blepharisma stoltei]